MATRSQKTAKPDTSRLDGVQAAILNSVAPSFVDSKADIHGMHPEARAKPRGKGKLNHLSACEVAGYSCVPLAGGDWSPGSYTYSCGRGWTIANLHPVPPEM